jgi:hypothetical protein
VNEPARIDLLHGLGVDTIITDAVDMLAAQ